MFDKQKLILVLTKYASYAINIGLVAGVCYLVYFWIMTLINAASA